MVRWPDFFIVGAPKSGTTSMWSYLFRHPEIFMNRRKEPHFFGSDLNAPPGAFVRDAEAYTELFRQASDTQRVGEKSVWYLYSERAAKEIHDRVPDADIIIMLRDPVEMIYSMHSQRVQSGNEDIPKFEEAIRAEDDRKEGRRIPRSVHVPSGLLYTDVGKYAAQVKRYLETFGEENVHITLFDDFKEDTARVFEDTLRFLDVDPGFEPQLTNTNPNQRIRFFRLHRFLTVPPERLKDLATTLFPRKLVRRVVKQIRRWLRTAAPRPPMDPDLREELSSEFRGDVEKLESLIGRDLSHWHDRSSPKAPGET